MLLTDYVPALPKRSQRGSKGRYLGIPLLSAEAITCERNMEHCCLVNRESGWKRNSGNINVGYAVIEVL